MPKYTHTHTHSQSNTNQVDRLMPYRKCLHKNCLQHTHSYKWTQMKSVHLLLYTDTDTRKLTLICMLNQFFNSSLATTKICILPIFKRRKLTRSEKQKIHISYANCVFCWLSRHLSFLPLPHAFAFNSSSIKNSFETIELFPVLWPE